ncbi:thioredoxin family protein [Parabacteroides pacaensis]|uniref:thioredoxin family protein n=1 Tax=Parabacteroides pacaensis TaxID=2086575 RepID=UPI000D0ED850|nr:thioredoxin family protein [Parabacteroides pacaensis]
MKVRAYVLLVLVAIFIMSATTKKAGMSEGTTPGYLAPRIEFLGNESDFNFSNHSGRYTLLNFWAAYDAESRARNVQLANEVSKWNPDKIAMLSVSFDRKESIFAETVKADKLDAHNQFWNGEGKLSKVYRKYGLKHGFRNFLIDDKGIIIATNVSAKQLTELLRKN